MTATNWKRGATRLCAVSAVAWILGMGWYQYNEVQKAADNGVTIELSKDTQLHIDANGIQKDEKSKVRMERMGWVFLPALLILLIVPVGDWLARGFRPEEKS